MSKVPKYIGCKVTGCNREHSRQGFCEYHRTQFRRGIVDCGGNILRERFKIPSNGRCKIEGCQREHDSHGFCATHLYQFQKGLLDKDGKRLKQLYDSLRLKIGVTQYDRGVHRILQRYFGGGPLCKCKMCGKEFEFYQMDGHHPDKSKKEMAPSRILHFSFFRYSHMLAELDRLEWVCCHCHSIIHAGGDDVPYSQTNVSKRGKIMDKQIVEVLKMTGNRCLDCGRVLGRRTAIFHHRNPLQKVANISQIVGQYKLDFVLKEVEKCDILCSPCHRKRHRLNRKLHSDKKNRELMLFNSPIRKKKYNGKQGCRVVDCDEKHFGRGYCKRHLYRFSVGMIDADGKQLRLPFERAG